MISELHLLEPTGENLRTSEEQVDRICERSRKKLVLAALDVSMSSGFNPEDTMSLSLSGLLRSGTQQSVWRGIIAPDFPGDREDGR